MLAGAVSGRIIEIPSWIALCLAAGCLFAGGVLAVRRRSPERIGASGMDRLAAAGVVFLLAGFFLVAFFQQDFAVRREKRAGAVIRERQGAGRVILRGTAAGEPDVRAGRERVLLVLRDVQVISTAHGSRHIPGHIQVSLVGEAAQQWMRSPPFQGDRVQVHAAIQLPQPRSHADLFDYRSYLRSRGIGGVATVWDTGRVSLLEPEGRNLERAFFSCVMRWRRSTLALLSQHLPPERAAVLRAMLLGETGGLDPDQRRLFNRAGVSHLFAVSGLHTGLLALMVFLLCRLVRIPPRASVWVLFAFLLIYCVLIGFRAPVVRGSVMAACLGLPYLARRRADHLTALSLAVILTLVVNPLAILRIDFQFSYLCAFGIITLYPTLSAIFRRPPDQYSFGRRQLVYLYNQAIAGPLAVVLAAQLSLLPLLAVYFHQVSLIGFVANLFLVPWAFLVLAAGAAFSILGPLGSGLAGILGDLVSILTGGFIWMAHGFSRVSFASVRLPTFPWLLMTGYYLLLFVGPHMRMRSAPGEAEVRRARLALRVALAGVLVAWWPVLAGFAPAVSGPPGEFRLTMLDVGQGDCLAVELPDRRVFLIDTGPRQAGRSLTEYLRAEGIDEIEALIVTHTDADHIGAAPALFDECYVRRVLMGPSRSGTETQRRLDEALAHESAPVYRVGRGDRLGGTDPVRIEFLHPERSDNLFISTNERSVVTKVEYGEMTFLLTGDLEQGIERELVRALGAEMLEAEVLKVAHHGSGEGTGEVFLRAVRPEVALISVGRNNRYGHPGPDVLDRLARAGADVFSTPDSGFVELCTDGKRLWVRTAQKENSQ